MADWNPNRILLLNHTFVALAVWIFLLLEVYQYNGDYQNATLTALCIKSLVMLLALGLLQCYTAAFFMPSSVAVQRN